MTNSIIQGRKGPRSKAETQEEKWCNWRAFIEELVKEVSEVETSSLKIDEIDMSISSIQASKSQKRDFRHFSGAKVCYSNGNVKFENFMHIEWSEEKFLKGIVGDKTRLRFWNKHQNIELFFGALQ